MPEKLGLRLPWMSRRDRDRWKSTQTIGELGELMALWLEGVIQSRPGYTPRHGPDDETSGLVASLAAMCRAGFVTTDSQPGWSGTGWDGLWWEQRAVVQGVLTDPELLDRLVQTAADTGLVFRINDYSRCDGVQEPPVAVTARDGEIVTSFAGRARRADRALQWQGLNRQLHDQVVRGTYLAIAAPEYGRDGDRLWTALDFVTGLRTVPENDPWAPRTTSPTTKDGTDR
ncbi:hypothetical protein PV516_19140 [Streptomyces scabiei]|uniref:DUF6919 domain-containing protein n=1 Tax=Streptomyces scabiei TaxID=1930 RepID=UPI0029A4C0BB|nr:hypothetical protein [Streptomyces scabiei]MDX3165904.1 hypothetical protein [Streptomyces scabiei]